jgi:hypothetical protein
MWPIHTVFAQKLVLQVLPPGIYFSSFLEDYLENFWVS